MPQLTEVAPIAADLASLTLGTPTTVGAITVVPLHRPDVAEPGWLTLAEAGGVGDHQRGERRRLRAHARREEQRRSPGAPARRRGAARRQAEPHPEHHGAGGGAQQHHDPGELRRAGPLVLSQPSLHVERLLAVRVPSPAAGGPRLRLSAPAGRHDSDQREVWDGLAEKAEDLGVESPTGAMHAVYEQLPSTTQRRSAGDRGLRGNQTGALDCLRGRGVGRDGGAGGARAVRTRVAADRPGYLADRACGGRRASRAWRSSGCTSSACGGQPWQAGAA